MNSENTFSILNLYNRTQSNPHDNFYITGGQVFLALEYLIYVIPLVLISVRLGYHWVLCFHKKRNAAYSKLGSLEGLGSDAEPPEGDNDRDFPDDKTLSSFTVSGDSDHSSASTLVYSGPNQNENSESWSSVILPTPVSSPPTLTKPLSAPKAGFQLPGCRFVEACMDPNLSHTQVLNKSSVLVLLLGFVYIAVYLADVVQIFAKLERHYSRDFFILLLVVLIVPVYLTLEKSSSKSNRKPLSREQTEEWKGAMQIVFLLYHYFAAKEVYNMIRVLIAAYVWLTGFGNFSYFYTRKDYSPMRLARMLFRLNFAVAIMAVTTNNEYMLYYICPMHTYWFLSVYAMMAIKSSWNYQPKKIALKFLMYAVCNFALFEGGLGHYVFQVLGPHSPLRVLSLDGSLHEWFFRASLDRWVCLAGMVTAYLYPHYENWLVATESPAASAVLRNSKRIAAAVSVGSLVLWFQYILYPLDKFAYNALHPYTAAVPITAYIFLRNYTAEMRAVHSSFLTWMGKRTLETYLLQFHLWLVDKAKSVLLIPFIPADYPLCNFIVATLLYIISSDIVFEATNALSVTLFGAPGSKKAPFASKTQFWWILLGITTTFTLLLSYFISNVVTRLFNSNF